MLYLNPQDIFLYCRSETIKNTLDVFTVCTVTPKTQLALLHNISVPDNMMYPAVRFV
jgi:hypothetical protein